MDKQKTIIHWFRKGLRIHDNPGNQNHRINMIEANDLIMKISPPLSSFVRSDWKILNKF